MCLNLAGLNAAVINFHGLGDKIYHPITFCGACYKPGNDGNPVQVYSSWNKCQDEGFTVSTSANNQSLYTWSKTLNISDCILRWKWRELAPDADQNNQYELYRMGDRTLNLLGLASDLTVDVYTVFDKFESNGTQYYFRLYLF